MAGKEIQAGPPEIGPIVDPIRFELKHGVKVSGGIVREIEIGPSTDDDELRAMLTLPDEIDIELIYKLYGENAVRAHNKTLPANKQIKIEKPLTKAERRRAAIMIEVQYRYEMRYRVTYFGGLPAAQIPDAIGKLTSPDSVLLLKKAQEVDKRVANFLKEDKATAATGLTANEIRLEEGDDGPTGPPGGPDGV